MGYIFTEKNFKDYFKYHAKRDWFSKDPYNSVRYKNRAGTYYCHDYDDKYTLKVKETLKDPGLIIDERATISQMNDMYNNLAMTGASGVATAAGAPPSYVGTNIPSPLTTRLANQTNTY